MRTFPAVVTATLMLMTACAPKPAATTAAPPPAEVTSFLKENGLEGRVVLVEFGTVGCELSAAGLDFLADLATRQAMPGLGFARIEPVADDKVFDDFYKPKSLSFPVVRDRQMKLAKALGMTIYPQFALLDKSGRVRYRGTQPGEPDLAGWVTALQAETADAGAAAPVFGSVKLDAAALLAATSLPDLAGKARPLADYQGKAGTLLAFVDTKCPFSSVAIGEFPKVAAILRERAIASLLVNIGEPESEVKKGYEPGTAVVYDTGKQAQRCWNVQSVPTLFLLDSAGAVAYQGGAVWPEVARAAEKVLGSGAGSVQFEAQGTPQG